MSIISIKNLTKKYADVTPIEKVNLEVEEGEVISIIGPSGTGKSTLLRCINRLETPSAGVIEVDGVN
ncbi:MAG: amino acid ABC transporter ATP-binding protein, partial [Eubacterium sp.]|nr:amino acid ABC transporter ATP-binding protein [Eubacterium sp.]